MSIEIAKCVEIAAGKARSGPAVIVFADSRYTGVLHNWLRHAQAVGCKNIVVCALDTRLFADLSGADITCCSFPYGGKLSDLWVKRAHLFAALCNANIDFIHSDADAVWLRNPVERVFELGADIAFSQGTVWPSDIVREWGFVLCCGFFAVRAGLASSCYFEAVAAYAKTCGDDQVAVNRILRDDKLVWRKSGAGESRSWEGEDFVIFNDPLFGTSPSLSVALLPHKEFLRLPEKPEGAFVAHPLSPKTGHAKIEILKQLGLWLT